MASSGSRQANARRGPGFFKLVVVTLLLNFLILGAAGYFLYKYRDQIPDLGLLQRMGEMAEAGTGRRIGALEQEVQRQAKRVEELSSALAAQAAKGAEKQPATGATGVSADLLASVQGDLAVLRERNRLAALADEAIATGSRAPYEKLWAALGDPKVGGLDHAARSEILRVHEYYVGATRIDRFDIPVSAYFPDEGALLDVQLKDGQLIKLLGEKKNPWQVRLKAANLLGTRRSTEVGDALLEAVRHDDNLDVAKEACFSFEQMTGFHSQIFDWRTMERWWQSYKETPTSSNSQSAAPPVSTAPGTGGGLKAGPR